MIEFAFVFPLLFMLMYGIVVYGYLFVLQESLQFAAQEAAEAVVAVDPREGDDELRRQRVGTTVRTVMGWLPTAQLARISGPGGNADFSTPCPRGGAGCPEDTDGWRVTLVFNLGTPTSLFPVVNFPLVGAIPPMPQQLVAQAIVRI